MVAASLNAEKCDSTSGGGSRADRQRRLMLLWVLGFLGFRVVVPLAAFLPLSASLVRPVALLAFMLLSLLGPRLIGPLPLRPVWRALLFPILAALSLATAGALPGTSTASAGLLLSAFSDLFLIGAASVLGALLAGFLREPNILVPASVVAALVDFWGVYFGTTRMVLERHQEVVSKLSVQVALPALPGALDLQIGIGFGDFVFLSFFLVCARRFDLREGRTFWFSFVFLLAAMAIVVWLGPNVPALLPMAAAFLAANAGCFRLQRSEALAMLYAGLIIAVLLGGWIFLHG